MLINNQYLQFEYKNNTYRLYFNKIINKLAAKNSNTFFNQSNIINISNEKLSNFLVKIVDKNPIMNFGLAYKCVSQDESSTSCIIQVDDKQYNIETLLFIFTNNSINIQNRMKKQFSKEFEKEYTNFINSHKYVIFIICANMANKQDIEIDMKFYNTYPSEIVIKNYINDYINSIFGQVDNIQWF